MFRLRLKGRILAGFAVPIVLGLGVAGFGVRQFTTVRDHNRAAAELATATQRVLEVSHLLETVRRAETHYRLDADQASLAERDEAEARIRAILAGSQGAATEAERREADALTGALRAHDQNFSRLVLLTDITGMANYALNLTSRDVAVSAAQLIEAARDSGETAALQQAVEIDRILLEARLNNWRFQALYDPKGPTVFERERHKADIALAAIAAEPYEPVRKAAAEVGAALDNYAVSFKEMADATLAGLELDQSRLVPEIVGMQQRLLDLQNRLVSEYQLSDVANARLIDRAALAQRVLAIALLIGGTGLAWLIGRGIARPLIDMTAAMVNIARGNTGTPVPAGDRSDEIGDMARAVVVFREGMLRAERLTAELRQQIARREQAEAEAAELARHGPLTGLPNRRLFSEEMTRSLAALADGDRQPMMLIDLDGFKAVNDVHGHQAGDAVLQDVTVRLKAALPPSTFVARLGGDEFAILMPRDRGRTNLAEHAYAIICAVAVPFVIDRATVQIGASIGIACSPIDGANASALLRAADIAMYRAKAEGGGAACFFEAKMDTEMRAHALLREEVRAAIADGEIVPYYQPLVDLRRNEVVGCEVLARWVHPERGVIAPEQFLPQVEQMKLSTTMTRALLRQACADARAWPEHIRMAVNIAPAQLREPGLIQMITAIAVEAGIAPARIEIELVEHALIGDIDEARRFIDAAHRAGMTVALDDFGTGHSSLSRLYELPLDKVKIDRSFMRNVAGDPRSAAYVAAIINLGKTLELHTTAEGIENQEVVETLGQMGCDFGQGYLYAKPLPAAGMLGILRMSQSDPHAGDARNAAAA